MLFIQKQAPGSSTPDCSLLYVEDCDHETTTECSGTFRELLAVLSDYRSHRAGSDRPGGQEPGAFLARSDHRTLAEAEFRAALAEGDK